MSEINERKLLKLIRRMVQEEVAKATKTDTKPARRIPLSELASLHKTIS